MIARVRSLFRNPVYVVAAIGLIGFLVDMFLKPISNAGLILIALASSPWLTRIIKSAKVAGVELELAPPAPPASTGVRLAEEVAEPTGTSTIPQTADESGGLSQAVPGSAGRGFPPNQRLASAYLASGLVLQDIQRETAGFLQKEVQIGVGKGMESIVDGLVLAQDKTIAVEVKLLLGSKPARAVIQQLVERYSPIVPRLRSAGYPRPSLIIAIVSDQEPQTWKRFLKDWHSGEADLLRNRTHLKLRHYHLPDLLTKYGFADKKSGQNSVES